MALGLLVLLAGLVLVGAAWGAVDAKATAAAAAREAARAYVEAPDSATASESADAAAREVVAGYGRDERRLELVRSGDFGRCARITYEALYPLPVLRVPFSDSSIGGWIVRARHSEVVDPFRSGLAGKADCGR